MLVKGLMSVTREEGKESVETIDDAPIVEVSGWFNRATLDVIGSAGMGVEFDAIENPNTKVKLNSFLHTTILHTHRFVDQRYIPQCLLTEPLATDDGSIGVRTLLALISLFGIKKEIGSGSRYLSTCEIYL